MNIKASPALKISRAQLVADNVGMYADTVERMRQGGVIHVGRIDEEYLRTCRSAGITKSGAEAVHHAIEGLMCLYILHKVVRIREVNSKYTSYVKL